MKDLYSNWMIDWMTKKGIPAHKVYDYVGFLGFVSFFLVLFISIIVQNIELSGWLGMVCVVLFLLIAISLLIVSGYCTYQANYMWLMLLLFGSGDIIMGLAIDPRRCMAHCAHGDRNPDDGDRHLSDPKTAAEQQEAETRAGSCPEAVGAGTRCPVPDKTEQW